MCLCSNIAKAVVSEHTYREYKGCPNCVHGADRIRSPSSETLMHNMMEIAHNTTTATSIAAITFNEQNPTPYNLPGCDESTLYIPNISGFKLFDSSSLDPFESVPASDFAPTAAPAAAPTPAPAAAALTPAPSATTATPAPMLVAACAFCKQNQAPCSESCAGHLHFADGVPKHCRMRCLGAAIGVLHSGWPVPFLVQKYSTDGKLHLDALKALPGMHNQVSCHTWLLQWCVLFPARY